VQKALKEKQKREAGELLDALRPLSLDCKENQIYGDMNLVNAAFLIERTREKEFDRKVQELDEAYGERKKIKYVGPMVPYNFVEIVVNF
jgi:Gas vesicle synthesis protein GvpL/GvpF